MAARITTPLRTTDIQSLGEGESDVASPAETQPNFYAQAVAEADAQAAAMLDERRAVALDVARPTTPLTAVQAPRRMTNSRTQPSARLSFFLPSQIALPPLQTRGERVTQVAQHLGVEAALVERAAAELEAKELPTDSVSLMARSVRVQLIAQVARQIGADAELVERAAAELETEGHDMTALVLRQRGQRVRYEERVREYNARQRAIAAERGEYGLEQLNNPTAADRTPENARARLQRDAERYDFILRPAD